MQMSLQLTDAPIFKKPYAEKCDFPTYLLVVQQHSDCVKPQLVYIDKEFVPYHRLTSEQKEMPVYEVFCLDDELQVNSYQTLTRDIQVYVDCSNRENGETAYNPDYVPRVPMTEGDVRFVAQADMCGRMYGINKTVFMSYWKRGFKTIKELDDRVEALRPKYDVPYWKRLAEQHKKGELTLTVDERVVRAMKAGEVVSEYSATAITEREIEARLKVLDSVSHSVYVRNWDTYQLLGLDMSESVFRLDGVVLEKDVILGLLQLDGRVVSLPNDIIFASETYGELKKLFEKASAKYHNNGFVFDSNEEAVETFNRLLSGEVVDIKKSLQYYPTTEEACKDLLSGVDLNGKVVFEPNGGEGFLVRKAYSMGASRVKSAEIYKKFHPALEASGAEIIGDDLLSVTATDVADVDVVIMNPPFAGGLDVKHVKHVLNIVPSHVPVYAIMSNAVKQSQNKIFSSFRDYLRSMGVKLDDVEAGAFKSSGTNICAVSLRIPSRDQQLEQAA